MARKIRTYGKGHTADIEKAEGPFKRTLINFKTPTGIDPDKILYLIETIRDKNYIGDLREATVNRNPSGIPGIDNWNIEIISKTFDASLFEGLI